MSDRETTGQQDGGVNLSASQVTIGGDVVGRDKITVTHGISAGELAELARLFTQINQKIDARPQDPNVDKAELKETVKKIEEETRKGEQANPAKVERWLRFLAGMADDIFQVTAATLLNPAAGIAKTIQLIAKKATQESSADAAWHTSGS